MPGRFSPCRPGLVCSIEADTSSVILLTEYLDQVHPTRIYSTPPRPTRHGREQQRPGIQPGLFSLGIQILQDENKNEEVMRQKSPSEGKRTPLAFSLNL